EEDMVSVQRREEASDRRLQQLQSSIKQLEARLCVTIQEATQAREENTHLEKQTRELQAKCNELENEKYGAIARVRNSVQLLEEANLQKNQVLLEKKQKEEDREKMKEKVFQITRDAAMRTRKEECAEKKSQIERAMREKKAVEEELEKVKRKRKK
ncbi:hypothetical protein MC885_018013, partial [Smutsia gigantea]